MKSRNIKFSLLFLISSFLLTSCNSESLGNDISSSIEENLIPNLYSTLAQIVATIILFTCIIFLAYKPAKKFLNKRKEMLDNEVSQTKKDRSDAEIMNLEAKKNLAQSKKEAKEIIDKAKVDASLQKEEILLAANEEAKQKINDAESIIKKQQQEAQKQIKDAIVDVAVATSSKILEREVNEKDNQKIIDDFINEIDDIKDK